MKDIETKEKFIELRASGMSYQKITDELKVSKPTLINWDKEFRDTIYNLKAVRLEALEEEYCLSIESKVRLWGKVLQRLEKEFESRDLSLMFLDTDKLFSMLIKAQEKLESVYSLPNTMSEEEIERAKRYDESKQRQSDSLQAIIDSL